MEIKDCQICTQGQPKVDAKVAGGLENQHLEYFVHCPACHTSGPMCRDKQEAIDHWNNLHSYNDKLHRLQSLEQRCRELEDGIEKVIKKLVVVRDRKQYVFVVAAVQKNLESLLPPPPKGE